MYRLNAMLLNNNQLLPVYFTAYSQKNLIWAKPPPIHLTNHNLHSNNHEIIGTLRLSGQPGTSIPTLACQVVKQTVLSPYPPVIWMKQNCVHVSSEDRTQCQVYLQKTRRKSKLEVSVSDHTLSSNKTALEIHWPTCTKFTHFSSYVSNWCLKKKEIVRGH